jgi:hypothetical protein
MTRSARVRATVGVALLALLGALALAGCARGSAGSAGADDYTDLSVEGQALEAIGFSPDELVPLAAVAVDDPTPKPTVRPSGKPQRDLPGRHKRLRFAFGQRMLHGEAVVQTDQGTRTVVVQRGTVTAIDGSTVTVKSADGFTLTWTFGNPIHVIEHRTAIQPSAIAVGTAVGVAGGKEGDTPIARLIVIPRPK